MERFAKRKVIILPSKNGTKLVWFKPDKGEKMFVAEYSNYLDNDSICADVKHFLSNVKKTKMAYEALNQKLREREETLKQYMKGIGS